MEEVENEIVKFDESSIRERIVEVRGMQVMLDRDLAKLYGVTTSALNQAVARNPERFPDNFMFRMKKVDIAALITDCDRLGKLRYWPEYVNLFTEQGIAMLSAVLRSETAIQVSIKIMNAFVMMRRFVLDHAGLVQRVGDIETKLVETNKRVDAAFSALDRGNLLPNGIISGGSEFDSLRMVTRFIESATTQIVLIDPYSDGATLEVLAKKRAGVRVRLVCKNRGQPTKLEVDKFNRQYGGLTVDYTDLFHDRFLIVDGSELHGLGSSINSLGRRVTSYTTRDSSEISKILALLS